MTNALTTFTNEMFGAIRTLTDENGEPLFVASDIAKALGYREAEKMTRNLDPEDKGPLQVGTPGGTQKMTVINESGLYAAIFASKLPTAKQFKRWVTKDVLPAIRKDGMYVQGEEKVAASEMSIEEMTLRVVEALQVKTQRLEEELQFSTAALDAFVSGGNAKGPADIARFLRGQGVPINTMRVKADLVRLGYLREARRANGHKEYRIRMTKPGVDRLFYEQMYQYGPEDDQINISVFVTAEGAKLILKLANAGKLTKLKGAR